MRDEEGWMDGWGGWMDPNGVPGRSEEARRWTSDFRSAFWIGAGGWLGWPSAALID